MVINNYCKRTDKLWSAALLYVVNGRESYHLAAKHSVSVLDSNAERQFSLPTCIALSIRYIY